MEPRNCDACNLDDSIAVSDEKARDYITGDEFALVRCRRCGLVYVNPAPGPEEMERYYPPSYYSSRRSFYEPLTISSRVRKIIKAAPAPKRKAILDVGCGRGGLLAEMKKLGWEVHGTELSDNSSALAKEEFGLDIIKGDIHGAGGVGGTGGARFDDSFFDAVTMWHFLEHARSPSAVIKEAVRILKPGGLLIAAVPNIESLQYRLSKNRWFHLDVPRHLSHFTPETLTNLLQSAGLDIDRMKQFSFEYDTFGLVQSVLNMIVTRQNFLFEIIQGNARKTKAAIGRGQRLEGQGRLGGLGGLWDLAATLALTPLLIPPAVLISCISSLAGLGGTIEAYAKKPFCSQ